MRELYTKKSTSIYRARNPPVILNTGWVYKPASVGTIPLLPNLFPARREYTYVKEAQSIIATSSVPI